MVFLIVALVPAMKTFALSWMTAGRLPLRFSVRDPPPLRPAHAQAPLCFRAATLAPLNVLPQDMT